MGTHNQSRIKNPGCRDESVEDYVRCNQKNGRVAKRLERLPTVPKTTVRDPPKTNGWTFAHCPPNSEWDRWKHWGYKGGEERNWLPYLKSRWLRTNVLSNRHSSTYGSYMGLTFTLTRRNRLRNEDIRLTLGIGRF